MSALRQRSLTTTSTNNGTGTRTTMNDNHEDDDDMPVMYASGLEAPKMLRASPQEHGDVMRLRVSTFYTFLPSFLQRLIAKIWFLSFLLPKWEKRYLILLGSYLYKFKDSSSKNPKGSPVPLEGVEVYIVDMSSPNAIHYDLDGLEEPLSELPIGYQCVFVVSTFRKKYYYATSSRETSITWINSIRQARQETITRNMGHAPKDSYPTSWEYYDRLGTSFAKRKDRIRAQIDEQTSREMEMAAIGAAPTAGGTLPRGVYG